MYGRKIVRALVSAFNVHNYARNTVKTNFTLQSRGGEDYIVVSFDKGMKDYQCSEYLDSIKRKIIREFYGIEESNDKEILDTAKKDFDVTSFPFNYIYKGDWSVDKQGRIEFVAPVDQGVIFNLKSHLAASLAKGVLEDMRVSSTAVPFNKKKYLWCGEFDNKQLREEFEREFLSRMENRYGYRNGFKNPLKVKGNSVYIRDVFDDARFIDSVARYITWLKGMGLQADSKVRGDVKAFKELIMEFIDQPTEIIIAGFVCASPLGREEASVLIPLVLDGGRKRILTNEEALKLNCAFNGAVFNDLYGGTQGELAINGGNGLYSIDFSNPYISHCVITKIIESSVINKDHELAIDPELRLQALSPAQSPVRVPNGPSSYLTESLSPTQEFPTQGHGEELGRSPRRGSEKEKEGLLHNPVNLAGTSKGFLPSPQLNSIAVSYGVSGPSSLSQSVSAAQNVQAWTSPWSQQPNRWSLPAPSVWSLPQSGPSSWKGANESGSAWTSQPIGFWSSPAPSAGPSLRQPSRPLSRKGASERRTSDKPLTEEEEKLSKALLYWFNLNNHALDPPHTNFIVKNGKIASLIDDSVNVKEYLQEIIDKTKEEYRVNEKEGYDLNEFPFKFLSNCEKNQETTVVANISRGALLNLKKLFSREHEGKVEIKDIDINIVKKDVESKKDEWVDSQVKKGMVRPREAIATCYPDESALKHIPIIKDKGGYCLDRTYENWEVESFLEERRCAKGTSKAKKMKSEDNKDSGISSGEATTSSDYEFMDCENTRGGSPKCTLELSMGMEELAISTDLDATKVEQHSPTKKFRSN